MGKVQTLKEWQPEATNIRDAGTCHECKNPTMLFYQLLEFDTSPGPDGYIPGGFYCEHCGWGNAGAMKVDDPECNDDGWNVVSWNFNDDDSPAADDTSTDFELDDELIVTIQLVGSEECPVCKSNRCIQNYGNQWLFMCLDCFHQFYNS